MAGTGIGRRLGGEPYSDNDKRIIGHIKSCNDKIPKDVSMIIPIKDAWGNAHEAVFAFEALSNEARKDPSVQRIRKEIAIKMHNIGSNCKDYAANCEQEYNKLNSLK